MKNIFYLPPAKWGSWFICSLLFHALLFLLFIWQFSNVHPVIPPAPAIMLQWAENIEAPPSPLQLPVGISQQEATTAEEEQQTEDKQHPPVPEDRDATVKIDMKKKTSDGKKKKPRPMHKTKEQASDNNHAVVSSNSVPQASVESSRIAAPFNSDSSIRDNPGTSWESRVKGHLNRYKRYPSDARKRARTGTAVVTFTVNAEGEIINSALVTTSGTLSLDREAVAVLKRAQPLPRPPVDILKGGVFIVKLPITFRLTELRGN